MLLVSELIGPSNLHIRTRKYLHGNMPIWDKAFPIGIPEQNPGKLVGAPSTETTPHETVCAWIDIAAPDSAPQKSLLYGEDLLRAIGNAGASVPITIISGREFFRFYVIPQLASKWDNHLKTLFKESISLAFSK